MVSVKTGFNFLSLASILVVNLGWAECPSRVAHAKELLGSSYPKSVVHQSEKAIDVTEFVQETVKRFLPLAYKKNSKKIATALLNEAEKRKLDPIFLMAMIQNESSFNPKMKGSFGEIGLMQVKPSTAKWIAKTHHLPYKGASSLYDPETNIRIGTALIYKLRNQFDSQSRLYVSAYNIGATKVRSMVLDKKVPKEYVMAVMRRYVALYSALNNNGDLKDRSELAWVKINDVSRRIAEN